jgi:hypothetical protein
MEKALDGKDFVRTEWDLSLKPHIYRSGMGQSWAGVAAGLCACCIRG